MLQTYTKEYANILSQHLPLSTEELQSQITLAPENIAGDFAFPCFQLAKTLGKSPLEISKELEGKLKTNQLFEKFVATGPYLNAFISSQQLANDILSEIQTKKADYGKGDPTNKQILIEGRNANTHKALHIGHLRNILVSESLARIIAYAGNEVVSVCYPGDIGAHVAKWIWYYLNFYEGELPENNFTQRVGDIYTKATLKVDENPDQYKADIAELQKKLEDGDPELQKVWKETRELCLKDFVRILNELWSTKIDKRYFESEVEQLGIEIVKKMLADGIAEHSQGAVAINLEDYKLGRFLLLKSTGASLYSTKDIALAYKKREDYPNYDASIYVVGSEQIHHFEQLFKTLEIIGFDPSKLKHLAYGLLDLKEGKMSSRAGNVILYETFRDQLLQKANEMMAERNISAEEKTETAKAIAFGAMKFQILLQDSEKKILFDEETALSFEGETGPYIQYTYARIASIIKKSIPLMKGEDSQSESGGSNDLDYTLLNTEEDKKLLLQIAKLPEEVQKAAQGYKPNYVARFCLDTAQLFNSYYHNHKIIDETNPELSKARLALSQTVQQVLKNGLELLSIDVVESM